MFGVSGAALLTGSVALYLVYAGIKDVPFFDGLRSIIRGEKPNVPANAPYQAPQKLPFGPIGPARGVGPSDAGIDRLVGNAKAAYPVFRGIGNWTIYGWGLRSDLSSDHPKGKALDIMNPTQAEAQMIIETFRRLPGAKYWIWNRQIANVAVDNWRIRAYFGASPHTDHVHLSFT